MATLSIACETLCDEAGRRDRVCHSDRGDGDCRCRRRSPPPSSLQNKSDYQESAGALHHHQKDTGYQEGTHSSESERADQDTSQDSHP